MTLSREITGLSHTETFKKISEVEKEEDLLEPQFYPDPVFFRASLAKLNQDEDILKKKINNKATLRALAPYLQIFHKDQKRKLESSAKQKPKVAKIPFAKKFKEQIITVVPNLAENPELIKAIEETADILKQVINSKKITTYLIDCKRGELYNRNRKEYLQIKPDTTMAAYVVNTKEHVVSSNVSSDSRFPEGLGVEDPVIKFGLGVPIKTPDDHVVGVYELVRDAFSVPFDKKDIQKVLAVTSWMGAAILQNSIYNSIMRQYEVTDCLQQLSVHCHCTLVNMEYVFSDIVVFARETLGAEYCSFYLVVKSENDYFIVDEFQQSLDDCNKIIIKKHLKKIVYGDGSYLYKVLTRKEVVNVIGTDKDVNNIDVRSYLCAPVVCSCNELLGAIQLINKNSQKKFGKEDEVFLQTFASFFAVNYHHKNLNDSAKKSEVQSNIIQNMLHHHIKPCKHDFDHVTRRKGELPENFFTFSWYPSPDHMPRLLELTITLFHEVLGDFFMMQNDVPKFVLTVQNCYRPNPYHNFLHAFAVTHTMGNIINRNHYIFNGLERKGLMVAALCHDADHRGYTNNFIQQTKHYLSSLYSSSPLENHHFSVAKMVIEQCNLFSYIKPDLFNQLLSEIYKYIIATDLALYFQSRMELMRVADEKTFTFKNPNHRHLVKSLLMTTCDLSGQTKPIAVCKKITEDVYEEFFQQGDIEKKMGFVPLPTMDRDKKDMIVENQVQFLSIVVIPCVETVSRIFGSLKPMLEDAKIILEKWKELLDEVDDPSTSSMSFKV